MSLFLKALNHSPGNLSGPVDFPLPLIFPSPEWVSPGIFCCCSVNVGHLILENNLSNSPLVPLLSDLYNDLTI